MWVNDMDGVPPWKKIAKSTSFVLHICVRTKRDDELNKFRNSLIHVARERSPCDWTKSRNYVQNTKRKTCFKEKVADIKSSERSLFGGFEDSCVTIGKSRINFPSKHQKRKLTNKSKKL